MVKLNLKFISNIALDELNFPVIISNLGQYHVLSLDLLQVKRVFGLVSYLLVTIATVMEAEKDMPQLMYN